MNYLSLFSGIGGFEIPLQEAGHKCVGFSEIDKYAIQVYKKHFPKHHNYGDITKINVQKLPDFDLIVGGFPCQSFSIAGKRGGFKDTRGTLFFNIAKIIKAKRPRLLLLENVKGLLSHDEGNTFATIISTIDELGYDCQWQVLNSKNFGVPQNRERVFIVGNLRGTSRSKVFPIGKDDKMDITKKYGLQNSQTAVSLRATDYKGTHNLVQLKGGSQGNRVYDPNGLATTIASQAGGLGAKTGLYAVLTPNRAKKRQNGRRFKKDGEPMFTLTGQDIHGVMEGARIRRLTPVECMKLQGFSDSWCDIGADGKEISDSQKYKMAGNAVTTNVVKEIIKRLLLK